MEFSFSLKVTLRVFSDKNALASCNKVVTNYIVVQWIIDYKDVAQKIVFKRKLPNTWIDQVTPPSSCYGFSQDEKRRTLLQVKKSKTCLGSMEVNWLEYLKKSNLTNQNQRVQTVPYLATPTIVVHLIFLVCRHLNQPPDVRYLAVELFDRFSYNHFKDLSIKVWSNNKIEDPKKQWDKVVNRVQSQVLLRLLSCVQIASKYIISDNDQVIRGKAVQQFLKEARKMYTLNSILSSEIRVFRTLGFKVHIPTTLVYVDFLIELLNLGEETRSSALHEISISVIDIAYLYHQEIYHKLHYISTGCWERTEQERLNFLPIECNRMFLASAIIVTSVNIVLPDQEDISTDICKQLDQLTEVPGGDIAGLAAIIMEQIIMT